MLISHIMECGKHPWCIFCFTKPIDLSHVCTIYLDLCWNWGKCGVDLVPVLFRGWLWLCLPHTWTRSTTYCASISVQIVVCDMTAPIVRNICSFLQLFQKTINLSQHQFSAASPQLKLVIAISWQSKKVSPRADQIATFVIWGFKYNSLQAT